MPYLGLPLCVICHFYRDYEDFIGFYRFFGVCGVCVLALCLLGAARFRFWVFFSGSVASFYSDRHLVPSLPALLNEKTKKEFAGICPQHTEKSQFGRFGSTIFSAL